MFGCNSTSSSQRPWEKVKLTDLAPRRPDSPTLPRLLDTINFDAAIYELPAEKLDQIDRLWSQLRLQPLRFYSYTAFGANLFVVRFGSADELPLVDTFLKTLGARTAHKVTLMLPNNSFEDLPVSVLPAGQTLRYFSTDSEPQLLTLGPGTLALRIRAAKTPATRDLCSLLVYPVFVPPAAGTLSPLESLARHREVKFTAAGFGLRMAPGGFVLLGPQKYLTDTTMLPGLFFSLPQPVLFFTDDTVRAEPKAAVRFILLVCTAVNVS